MYHVTTFYHVRHAPVLRPVLDVGYYVGVVELRHLGSENAQ